MQISDKGTFKRLQQAGLLGNYFRMWDTVQQVREAGYQGWLTVRARRASDRRLFIPAIRASRVYDAYLPRQLMVCDRWGYYSPHCPCADVYLQECPAPDTGRIINLEASCGLNGWKAKADDARLYVNYALNDPTNLRHSLEQNGKTLRGLAAYHLLRLFLEADLDQLEDIWDRHPDAVIEASRFTRRVGVFNSQTIIWEARTY